MHIFNMHVYILCTFRLLRFLQYSTFLWILCWINSLIYFADHVFIHLRLNHMFPPQYKKECVIQVFAYPS